MRLTFLDIGSNQIFSQDLDAPRCADLSDRQCVGLFRGKLRVVKLVSTLRRTRKELAERHEHILATPLPTKTEMEPRAGDLAFPNPDSAFLLIVSDSKKDPNRPDAYACLFEDQRKAFAFQMEPVGRSCSWFALEGPARALQSHLLRSLPKRRGRGA